MLGLLLLAPYLAAWRLGDLRQHTVGFEILFFTAFALYAAATVIALRLAYVTPPTLALIFVLAVAMQGVLILTRPTLSDDMCGRGGCKGMASAPTGARLLRRSWPICATR
jgi:hypothetical protein